MKMKLLMTIFMGIAAQLAVPIFAHVHKNNDQIYMSTNRGISPATFPGNDEIINYAISLGYSEQEIAEAVNFLIEEKASNAEEVMYIVLLGGITGATGLAVGLACVLVCLLKKFHDRTSFWEYDNINN